MGWHFATFSQVLCSIAKWFFSPRGFKGNKHTSGEGKSFTEVFIIMRDQQVTRIENKSENIPMPLQLQEP